jgi:hypothetical protein
VFPALIVVLWLLQVPFELLVRRQIARLLEPSLQCARFIYDELVKVSNTDFPGYILNFWSAYVADFHSTGCHTFCK